MKGTELRIGNMVLIPSHSDRSKPLVPCVIKTIKGLTMFSELDFTEPTYPEPHLVHINHCAGIPLTEDWLLKFGWGEGDFDTEYIDNVSLSQEVLSYTVNSNMLCIESNSDIIEINHIKYVHQLQNLYFALTSEELIIK